MAIEELFIASSVFSGALMICFLILYYLQKGSIWKTVWLFAFFAVIVYQISIENWGWINDAVIAQFTPLDTAMLTIMLWTMIGVFAYFGLSIFLFILNALWKTLIGDELIPGYLQDSLEEK